MGNRTISMSAVVASVLRLSLALALLLIPCALPGQVKRPLSPAHALLPMQQIIPTRSSAPLVNPGMGLYLDGTLNADDLPPGAWFSSLVQIGYFREDWSVLEPDAQGKYRFDEYFGPIFDLWVEHWHRRVAFRLMSENVHSRRKCVTPKWVFDQGVPSVTLKGLYAKEQIDPVFWDERYLAIQERFIADLGKYLDGRPGLEFIDIGSIGEWGEMHFARWTPEMLQQTGFSPTRYIAAYRRLIDAFARAFPRTRVFLNVGDYEAINDYAAVKGLHFRQDGLTPSGPSADVGKRFYRSYARRGVVCNYELHSGYDEMRKKGWGVRETFAKGLDGPISYLHINLMSYRQLAKAPEEVRQAVTDAAPCYSSYALRGILTDLQGRNVADQLVYPERPTTAWGPGDEVTLRNVVTLPANAPTGEYRLRVAMVEPENPSLRVQLGIAGQDAEGRHDLCSLLAEKRPASPAVVYDEGFEQGTAGSNATQGMTARADAMAHGGKGCLLDARGQHRPRDTGAVPQDRPLRRPRQVVGQHPDQELRPRDAGHMAAACRAGGNDPEHGRRPSGDREG